MTEWPTEFLIPECVDKTPGSLPKMGTAQTSPELQNPQLLSGSGVEKGEE